MIVQSIAMFSTGLALVLICKDSSINRTRLYKTDNDLKANKKDKQAYKHAVSHLDEASSVNEINKRDHLRQRLYTFSHANIK